MKKVFSIFTKDLKHCFISGNPHVHLHHIFEGERNRSKCEEDGYLIPLKYDLHEFSSFSAHVDKNFNNQLKVLCQEHWISTGKTREQFIAKYGQWWSFDGPRPAWMNKVKF